MAARPHFELHPQAGHIFDRGLPPLAGRIGPAKLQPAAPRAVNDRGPCRIRPRSPCVDRLPGLADHRGDAVRSRDRAVHELRRNDHVSRASPSLFALAKCVVRSKTACGHVAALPSNVTASASGGVASGTSWRSAMRRYRHAGRRGRSSGRRRRRVRVVAAPGDCDEQREVCHHGSTMSSLVDHHLGERP